MIGQWIMRVSIFVKSHELRSLATTFIFAATISGRDFHVTSLATID